MQISVTRVVAYALIGTSNGQIIASDVSFTRCCSFTPNPDVRLDILDLHVQRLLHQHSWHSDHLQQCVFLYTGLSNDVAR